LVAIGVAWFAAVGTIALHECDRRGVPRIGPLSLGGT
jgi:hypothetical protein